jgi:hypothetical protein
MPSCAENAGRRYKLLVVNATRAGRPWWILWINFISVDPISLGGPQTVVVAYGLPGNPVIVD